MGVVYTESVGRMYLVFVRTRNSIRQERIPWPPSAPRPGFQPSRIINFSFLHRLLLIVGAIF